MRRPNRVRVSYLSAPGIPGHRISRPTEVTRILKLPSRKLYVFALQRLSVECDSRGAIAGGSSSRVAVLTGDVGMVVRAGTAGSGSGLAGRRGASGRHG